MQTTHFLLQLPFRVYLNPNLGINKYNQDAYNLTMELFDAIPLSCLINKKFLCVHGGVSPDLRSVNHCLSSWRISRRSIVLGRFRKRGSFVIWCGLIQLIVKQDIVRG